MSEIMKSIFMCLIIVMNFSNKIGELLSCVREFFEVLKFLEDFIDKRLQFLERKFEYMKIDGVYLHLLIIDTFKMSNCCVCFAWCILLASNQIRIMFNVWSSLIFFSLIILQEESDPTILANPWVLLLKTL